MDNYEWLTDALQWHCDEVRTEKRGDEIVLRCRWKDQWVERVLERPGFSVNALVQSKQIAAHAFIAGVAADRPRRMPEQAGVSRARATAVSVVCLVIGIAIGVMI